MGGRSAPRIVLSSVERAELQRVAKNSEGPPAIRQRSRALLACADGKTNIEVGREVGLTNGTVGKLRAQFIKNGLRDFCYEKRGRPIKPLHLSSRELTTLQKLAARSQPYLSPLLQRANVILLLAGGMNKTAVARVTGLPEHTVAKIRHRFLRQRMDGLKT